MAGVVDAGEGEGAALLRLAVDDEVGGGDVDVAGDGKAGDVDGVVDGFAAEPVAWFALSACFGRYVAAEMGEYIYCCSLHLRIPL